MERIDSGPSFNRNLTRYENTALRDNKANNDIVIKTDKGSGVVGMDKHRFISEGERQLGDPNTYRYLETSPV